MRIGLLVSGSLGFVCLKQINKNHNIKAVLTDKNSKEISEFCVQNNIPCFIGNPRKNRASTFLNQNPIDLLLSINYLFLVEEDILDWPNKAAVNFHGSLLPKYRGRTPHVWAIINNEKETGITAHFMIKGCDEGDIIRIKKIKIDENDTGSSLLNKFEEIYPILVNEVLEDFYSKDVVGTKQNEVVATYFEKRTPDDGLINWSWQKERIRNWVRAQSHPYPGAFSFVDGKKIIIDELIYDDYGFKQSQPNGLILTKYPLRVKTPNGVVKLTRIREGKESLNENIILN